MNKNIKDVNNFTSKIKASDFDEAVVRPIKTPKNPSPRASVNTAKLALRLLAPTSEQGLGLNIVATGGRFMIYDPKTGVWSNNAEETIKHKLASDLLVYDYTPNIGANVSETIATLTRISDMFPVQSPGKVAFKNGTYDYMTDTFVAGWSVDDYNRHQIPHNYVPNKTAPNFFGWLTMQLGGNEALVTFIKQWIGYQFYSSYDIQQFLFLMGVGGSGKSTLLNIIQTIIGDGGFSNVGIHELNDRKSFQSYNLDGKLANFDADIKSEYIGELDAIKKLTGQDRVMADIKFKEPISFVNTAKATFVMNARLTVTDMNGELRRRMLVCEMNTPVSEETKAKYPSSKFVDEIEGIISESVAAFRDVIVEAQHSSESMSFINVPEMDKWRDDWIEGSDNVAQFLESAFDEPNKGMVIYKDDKGEIEAEELFLRFRLYAHTMGIRSVYSKAKFYDKVEALGYKKKQGYREIVVVRDEAIFRTGHMYGVKSKKARTVFKGLCNAWSANHMN